MKKFFAHVVDGGMVAINTVQLVPNDASTYTFTGYGLAAGTGDLNKLLSGESIQTFAHQNALELMRQFTPDKWAKLGRLVSVTSGNDALAALIQFRTFVETGETYRT